MIVKRGIIKTVVLKSKIILTHLENDDKMNNLVDKNGKKSYN